MISRLFSSVFVTVLILMVGISNAGYAQQTKNDGIDPAGKPLIEVTPDLFHNKPEFDSGWVSINKDQEKTIPHNIGGNPDRYVVELQFKDTGPGGSGVNQEGYGGMEYLDFIGYQNPIMVQTGAYWYGLTEKEIKVKRQYDDNTVDKVRIRIWLQTTPSFDSEWKPIAADGLLKNFDHNLGGDTDEYLVDMQFKDTDNLGVPVGVNQYGYGMIYSYIDPFDLESRGGLWRNLNGSTISVVRGSVDKTAGNFRIRIWKNKNPDYDSGWFTIDNGITESKIHNLGGNSDDYVVDLQFKDEGDAGVNQQFYGNNTYTENDGLAIYRQGAYWYFLTSENISIYREYNDSSAPKARVRIWNSNPYDKKIYLPLVLP